MLVACGTLDTLHKLQGGQATGAAPLQDKALRFQDLHQVLGQSRQIWDDWKVCIMLLPYRGKHFFFATNSLKGFGENKYNTDSVDMGSVRAVFFF